jgi:hypothetical protein
LYVLGHDVAALQHLPAELSDIVLRSAGVDIEMSEELHEASDRDYVAVNSCLTLLLELAYLIKRGTDNQQEVACCKRPPLAIYSTANIQPAEINASRQCVNPDVRNV